MLNAPELPILAKITKTGIRLMCVEPKNMIKSPPITDEIYKKQNAIFIPFFLYTTPPTKIPKISAKAEAREFEYIVPGKYLS